MSVWRIGFAVLALVAGHDAAAAGDALGGTPDTAAAYFARGPAFLARLQLTPWAELRLRQDAVVDRPGGPDFDRQRATLRAGLAWERSSLRIEAGVRASLGSDHNRETWSSFDNETADTVEVDRLGLRIASAAGDRLLLGRMRLPVPLTELLWDDDLRPVGLGFGTRLGWTGVDGVTLGGGTFHRSRFDADDVRLFVAQLGFERGNPATTGHEARLSYLGIANRDLLVVHGLSRQNGVGAVPGWPRPAEAFQVLDLQLAGHVHVDRWRITLRMDGAVNTAAADDRRAVRTRLAAGGAGAPWGLEAGWIYQRIERDAVPGALNSDDWWFHSRAQGHAAFAQAGLGRAVSARIVGFRERRDDNASVTRRLVVEARWNWGD